MRQSKPNFVDARGMSVPLEHEGKWARTYKYRDGAGIVIISRLADGSASLSLEELRRGWRHWTERDQRELCAAISALRGHREFPDMLRFMFDNGDDGIRAGLSSALARALPAEEAFARLNERLASAEPKYWAALLDGLAELRTPQVVDVLRSTLARLVSQPETWRDASVVNDFAYAATCCVRFLLDLKQPSDEFEATVTALATHPCAANRKHCAEFLCGDYVFLPQ